MSLLKSTLSKRTKQPMFGDTQPTKAQAKRLKSLYAGLVREQANNTLKEVWQGRTKNNILENEADFVAGASAMLQMVNEKLFGTDYERSMDIVPAGWILYIYSGRSLSGLFEDKETKEPIYKGVI